MEIKNMKNIVVLKDLPSNMIDEAFVILKENVQIHNMQKTNRDNLQQNGKKTADGKNLQKNDNIDVNKNNIDAIKNVNSKINKDTDYKDKGYLIKEAEMIVKEYADNVFNKNQNKDKKQIEKLQEKCARFKAATIFFGGFSLLCVINFIAGSF